MQPKQRRFVVPAVFAVVALVLGWAAVQEGSGTPTATAAAAEPPARPATPVLSARRLAPYLVAPIADAALRAQLDEVVAASPEATCLTVSVGGRLIYEHNPDMPLVPASTEKLVDRGGRARRCSGATRRFTTRVVAAGEPSDGVVRRRPVPGRRRRSAARHGAVRRALPQPAADPHVARGAGRPRRRGRRAPGERAAARRREPLRRDRYPDTWPERYAEQSQVGTAVRALGERRLPDWPDQQTREGTVESTPSADPPTYAAGQLAELLQARGVTVRGGAGAGAAPGEATEIATIESAADDRRSSTSS